MHCEVLIAERRCAAVSNFGQLIQKDPRPFQKSGIKTFTEPRIDLREGPISFIAAALSVERPRKCRRGPQFPDLSPWSFASSISLAQQLLSLMLARQNSGTGL